VELTRRTLSIIKAMGFELATPAEAREMIGLPALWGHPVPEIATK
jgi:uncharacterized protein (DUF849 family)